jgi:polyferredoxin
MNNTDSDKRSQHRCKKCGKVCGCDAKGRKHKCNCESAKILRRGIR